MSRVALLGLYPHRADLDALSLTSALYQEGHQVSHLSLAGLLTPSSQVISQGVGVIEQGTPGLFSRFERFQAEQYHWPRLSYYSTRESELGQARLARQELLIQAGLDAATWRHKRDQLTHRLRFKNLVRRGQRNARRDKRSGYQPGRALRGPASWPALAADLDLALQEPLMRLRPEVIYVLDLEMLEAALVARSNLGSGQKKPQVLYQARRCFSNQASRRAASTNTAKAVESAAAALTAMETTLLPRADFVVAASPTVLADLGTAGYRAKGGLVASQLVAGSWPFVRQDSLDPGEATQTSKGLATSDLRHRLGLPKDVPLGALIATPDGRDDVAAAFSALDSLDDVHLAVALLPTIHSDRAGALAATANRAGFSDRVHFVELPLGAQGWPEFLASASFGLVSRRGDQVTGFDWPLVALAAAGLPVAVPDMAAMADPVLRLQAGHVFLPDLEANDMALAVRAVLAEPELLKDGARRLADHFKAEMAAGQEVLTSLFTNHVA
ncbi:MAG: hypothetical protein FWG16_00065 [Micrococcales bacterium]|nr:hypothetical protein [Micrococcales bacterium]